MRTQLLCTFTKKKKVDETIDAILDIYTVVFDKIFILEGDSNDILEKLRMEYVTVEKMCLAQMPGGNRIGDDGKPKTRNFCKIDGMWLKYEPVYIWRKL